MKLKAYTIITDALERDIEAGVRSAFKHDENPTLEHIADMVYTRVLLGLNEIIDWEQDFDES